ncbi:fimbrial protein [Pseudomonas batumici]|uniref:Putative exported protein n=1 Tax=Pseudomonas batumici TaxID=226910 RepID=A0A0C2I243_9PSED|nr:fimbrial protein [Pseudomonas batumici]KIH81050.1 putative exported protein [Pseudomonas batumici]
MVNNWDGRTIHTVVLNNAVSFVSPTATCNLAPGDVNRTIPLDPVRISNFTGISTGLKYFDLTANCSNASNVTFRFTGTPEPTNSALFANTSGTARGVALWLHTPGQTVSHNSTRTVAVSGNRAVLRMGTEYHKTTGALTKGSLVSTVTVNITYN